MKTVVVDMTGVVESTHSSGSTSRRGGGTSRRSNYSGTSQQRKGDRIKKQEQRSATEESVASTTTPSNSSRIPAPVSNATDAVCIDSSRHSVAQSLPNTGSVASSAHQSSEMRRLLAEEKRSRASSQLEEATALVRSQRPPDADETEEIATTPQSTEDTISFVTMSESGKGAGSTTTNASTKVLLQRLLLAEEQTKQFQQEIRALTNKITLKEAILNEGTTKERSVKTTPATEPSPEQTEHSLWAWTNVVRKRFALDSNSIVDDNGVSSKSVVDTAACEVDGNAISSAVDTTAQEQKNNENSEDEEVPTTAASGCLVFEPWIQLLRDFAGLPNPSESSVVGLKVDQFKKDQTAKQKLRDLEQENLQLRRTLKVVQVNKSTVPGPAALQPIHRSCPGRLDDVCFKTTESEDNHEEEEEVEEGPQICLTASTAESSATPDAILSLSTRSSSATHSSSVTVRPTKKPPSLASTHVTTCSSVAQGSQISHDSRLESVPENEELSTNITTPPSTPPSDHNGSSSRKYCLKELRERSKLIRHITSRSTQHPPEAREGSKNTTMKYTSNGRRSETNRFRIRGGKPQGGEVLDESKWRVSFLERIEL